MNDTLFAIQSELIRKYADAGSCVIVGRCADKVLEKQEGLISDIYLCASGGQG